MRTMSLFLLMDEHSMSMQEQLEILTGGQGPKVSGERGERRERKKKIEVRRGREGGTQGEWGERREKERGRRK